METATRTIRPLFGEKSVSLALVTALAEVEGVDPVDLPPLSEHLDLEALDDLIEPADADVIVSFSINEYDVTVTSDGTVTID